MKFDPAKCRDEVLPNGWKSLVYDGNPDFCADYDPASVTRELAERAIKRLVEREPAAHAE